MNKTDYLESKTDRVQLHKQTNKQKIESKAFFIYST